MNRSDTIPSSTDNLWPVDSATRPCCRGIGSHTQACAVAAILAVAADAETMARELSATTAGLPDVDVPLFSVVDLTAAAAHLRAASRLMDRAARSISAAHSL